MYVCDKTCSNTRLSMERIEPESFLKPVDTQKISHFLLLFFSLNIFMAHFTLAVGVTLENTRENYTNKSGKKTTRRRGKYGRKCEQRAA